MRTEFARLLKRVRKSHADSETEIVRHAYRFADRVHQGQTRLSGDPYITHSLAVASILTALNLDAVTVSAGILHDVLEDTTATRDQLIDEFGDDIARLVDAVTKIGGVHLSDQPVSDEIKQAENLRKMLIATARDVRVILIKLADRLHNMQTIEFLPEGRQTRIALETLEIYVPIADRLGLSAWKWELEDHAFHALHPSEYREIARLVAMKRREREAALDGIIHYLEERLLEAEVNARVIGRPKHLYSIYQKMERQGKPFDEVHDVQAVRIITQTVSGCYNALGIIHQLWPPVRGRLKDYIAAPKLNMYQSIHTTVTLENRTPLEVQIRTAEMDRSAREGIAAHWKYKIGAERVDPKGESQLHWLRQMYDWLKDAHAPDELFDSLRRDISMTAVYVNTPKGEVKELPLGATPIDFAYSIHSDIGHTCVGARVNGGMVPLRYHLQTGDVCEIVTAKHQTPHTDWLDFVVSGRARTRIRQRLRELGDLPAVDGRDSRKPPKPDAKPRSKRRKPVRKVDDATRNRLVRIEGADGLDIHFARCCNPMPPQAIIGYVSKRQTLNIHLAECRLLERTMNDQERLVEARWDDGDTAERRLRVLMGSRPNGLADLTNAIRPMNIEITRAEFSPGKNGHSIFEFSFESADDRRAQRVARSLRHVSGVKHVDVLDTRPRGAASSKWIDSN